MTDETQERKKMYSDAQTHNGDVETTSLPDIAMSSILLVVDIVDLPTTC
jgi:hypothetical protein